MSLPINSIYVTSTDTDSGNNECINSSTKVLSVQSSVVYGYVGNKCSVYALQLWGIEIDPINTVQFSNHTGYPSFSGNRMSGEDLDELLRGLKENGILSAYNYILSGYMGSESFLQHFIAWMKEVVTSQKNVMFICDPVMGDQGKLYVQESFVSLYKELIPLAHVILPNQTEAELLSDLKIVNESDTLRVCRLFHDQGIECVIVTSISMQEDSDKFITICASMKTGNRHMFYKVPKIEKYYSGTGDLFASLFLCRYDSSGDFFQSCLLTIRSLQGVLLNTLKHGGNELRLVQSSNVLLNPLDSCSISEYTHTDSDMIN